MRRFVSLLALATLSLACSPQNTLNQLPTAPTNTNSNPSAAPGTVPSGTPSATLKPLAVGLKLTYEHKSAIAGNTTQDLYDAIAVNDSGLVVMMTRTFNGKEEVRNARKTLPRQRTVVIPNFARLSAGDFEGGYDAAVATAVEESVTVPAGTFMAKKLTMGTSVKQTYWISGTYLFKATTASTDESSTTELLKVE